MEVQWWCAAQDVPWEWSWQPFPGVWLFILLLAFGYRRLLRRAAAAGGAPVSGGRVATFMAGLVSLWLALDWPIGVLGAGYLASAHSIQFLLIALIAPPLLLWGTPPEALGALRGDSVVAKTVRFVTHPLAAIVVFNIIVGTTHVPAVSDTLMATQLGSFVIDTAWLTGGLIFWWPVIGTVPERPMFHELLKIVYMTGQAICMTPLFLYLTYSSHPVYSRYELAPPVHGFAALDDQRVAGLIMKVVGGFILMGILTVLFFRWARQSGDDPAELQALAEARERKERVRVERGPLVEHQG